MKKGEKRSWLGDEEEVVLRGRSSGLMRKTIVRCCPFLNVCTCANCFTQVISSRIFLGSLVIDLTLEDTRLSYWDILPILLSSNAISLGEPIGGAATFSSDI